MSELEGRRTDTASLDDRTLRRLRIVTVYRSSPRVDREKFHILDILKPDYIKIDGELMHALMTDADTQHCVDVIVKAARKRR